MFESFNENVQFVLVYIREAHALDSPQYCAMGLIEDPITLEEREVVAQNLVAESVFDEMLVLVDDMQDTAGQAYFAQPFRMALIRKNGTVGYVDRRHATGPMLHGLEQALTEELQAE